MKKHLIIFYLLGVITGPLFAQKEKAPLWEGNKFYKELNYQKSMEAYNKALTIAPTNPLANYNMGNTQFRMNKFEEAAQLYDNTISHTDKKPEREKAFYNKGVAFSKQKKLDESITAYKEALKLDPNDQEARENLQKALLEKKEEDKKKQGNNDKKEQEKDPKNKDDKKDKDDKKQDKQEKQNNQTKLSPQQIEQLLKALEQKEKEVQKKMQEKENEKEKQKSSKKPDKDW